MATWRGFARVEHHGVPPFGKSRVFVLVYRPVVFAVRPSPAVPSAAFAIENVDNLIGLTATIRGYTLGSRKRREDEGVGKLIPGYLHSTESSLARAPRRGVAYPQRCRVAPEIPCAV